MKEWEMIEKRGRIREENEEVGNTGGALGREETKAKEKARHLKRKEIVLSKEVKD